MPNLLRDALSRLRSQAAQDGAKPWKPGTQPTDAELLWRHIQKLTSDLSLAKDGVFLANDYWWTNGQPYYNEEEQRRGEQGIFG